jgi:hypothetical protein
LIYYDNPNYIGKITTQIRTFTSEEAANDFMLSPEVSSVYDVKVTGLPPKGTLIYTVVYTPEIAPSKTVKIMTIVKYLEESGNDDIRTTASVSKLLKSLGFKVE